MIAAADSGILSRSRESSLLCLLRLSAAASHRLDRPLSLRCQPPGGASVTSKSGYEASTSHKRFMVRELRWKESVPTTVAYRLPRAGNARLEGPIDSFEHGSLEATIPRRPLKYRTLGCGSESLGQGKDSRVLFRTLCDRVLWFGRRKEDAS